MNELMNGRSKDSISSSPVLHHLSSDTIVILFNRELNTKVNTGAAIKHFTMKVYLYTPIYNRLSAGKNKLNRPSIYNRSVSVKNLISLLVTSTPVV